VCTRDWRLGPTWLPGQLQVQVGPGVEGVAGRAVNKEAPRTTLGSAHRVRAVEAKPNDTTFVAA
jgi:hypothetical protein